MTVANLYPDINPSLLLDFANVRALDPRITFTRASSASYYDNLGVLRTATNNQARFDHDPVSGESLGLLIEEQRTNLVLRSEEFDNAYWTKTNSSITVNTSVAPNSTLTADKLVENTATGNHLFFVGSISSTATVFTASVYAKASERDRLRLQARNELSPSGGANADFNLTTQTVTIVNFGDGTGVGRIESVGNGWFRCSITVTVVTAGTTLVFAVFLLNAAGVTNYTGDGTSGILLWGAQLEAGDFVSSYVRTEASQATRLADTASITGTNFSSWYRPDEGTMYAETRWRTLYARNNSGIFRVDDGTNNNVVELGFRNIFPSAPGRIAMRVAGGTTAETTTGTVSTNDGLFHKFAGAYSSTGLSFSADNMIAGTTTTSIGTPVVNIARIGSSNTGVPTLYAIYIRKIAYYPQRLTNTQLQALTR